VSLNSEGTTSNSDSERVGGRRVTSKILLSGGCVLTLGSRTPNFAQGDVLIDEGVIVEVGTGLRARDAERVDATETIVMPGFVDTHRHTWTSLFRNLGDEAGRGSDAVAAAIGHLGSDDLYAATLIGLLGAAEAGITTVVDWLPVGSDPALLESALQAHSDAGLRSVLIPDPRVGGADDLTEQIETNAREGATASLRRMAVGSTLTGADDLAAVAGQRSRARDRGRRLHIHADPVTSGHGPIAAAGRAGLLGDDVTLVHLADLSDDDAEAVASSGASVSLAPSSDMVSGYGSPPIQQLIDRDIRPGLGIEDERVTPGDMFAQMRATISVQHATVFDRKLAGKAGLPRLMTTRDVIRYATVDGARAAGWGDVAGSIAPGMQADIIVLRTDRANIFPINDPIGAVVWGMDTSNIDRVFVGGRAVMRDGELVADLQRARGLAIAARDRVAQASGLVVGAGTPGASS
jgi:5-methylthioadenosine/S-adenosylhomocysteine deaminase